MQLLTLQLGVDRPHLGRLEVAATVGRPDINAHVMQVVRELKPEAEVPGFRKGRAPLKRVYQLSASSYQLPVRKRAGLKPRVLGFLFLLAAGSWRLAADRGEAVPSAGVTPPTRLRRVSVGCWMVRGWSVADAPKRYGDGAPLLPEQSCDPIRKSGSAGLKPRVRGG
jgi:hypothetical protein